VRLAIALLAAFAVASVLILIYGQSPFHVYALMLSRTWGEQYGLGQVLFRATPLVFTGLSVSLAFQARLFNIGAEGQLVAGSLACGVVGAWLPASVPGPLAACACVAAAALAGGAVGALPGALKARFGAHEVITTIMLNFIVQTLVLAWGRRWLFMEQSLHTPPVSPGARLPSLAIVFGKGTSASIALFLAIACALACWWVFARTRRGFELRALGLSVPAAQAGGVRVGRTIVAAMAASGALAGLVGTSNVLGYKGYFENGADTGVGFMGIAVALLARNNPIGVLGSALLFGTLAQGGLAAEQLVPKVIVEVIQAVIVLAMAWPARES
jgi:simple sugar transport system permease protein